MNWMKDPNSMEFVELQRGNLLPERIEDNIRAEFNFVKMQLAIQKWLVDGAVLICRSPRDSSIWIPDNDDVAVDWINMDFFSARRTLLDENDSEYEIVQGCFNQYGKWYEFEMDESGYQGQIWQVMRPTMVPLVYNIDPDDRFPFGIPKTLASLEKKKAAAEKSIYQAISRDANASLAISADVPKRFIDNLYNDKIMVMDTGNPQLSLRDSIVQIPSKIENIPLLAAEIERITEQAMRYCGLQIMQTPDDAKASVSTFAAQTAYEASTVTMRNMVERALEAMAIVYDNIMESKWGSEVAYCHITHNPLDAQEERAFLKEILPGLETAIREDPDGVLTLGMFRLEEIGKIYNRLFRLNKVSPSLIAPRDAQIKGELARGILTDRAKQQEQDAASVIAQAELVKSQASVANSQTNADKVMLEAQNKENQNLLELERIQIENEKLINNKRSAQIDAIKELAASYGDLEGNEKARGKIVAEIMDTLKTI